MIWTTWRQFRTQTWVTAALLAAVAILLVISGMHLADLYRNSGAAACRTECGNALANFEDVAQHGFTGVLYHFIGPVMYIVPGIIGAFWGAPLVAREIENGTHGLAWNQSVTRTRWLATKLAVVGAATVATMGLLSLGVTLWTRHFQDPRLEPTYFGTRGVVPMAYGLFAFMLGVAAGILIRRTLPAMAVAAGVYLGAMLGMAFGIRQYLLPATNIVRPLDINDVSLLSMQSGGKMTIATGDGAAGHGAWVLSNQTITPTGHPFTGPANMQACAGPTADGCLNWLNTLGLRSSITYQPANHFWPLQWIESGIFVALAAALAAFCFTWIRRHVS